MDNAMPAERLISDTQIADLTAQGYRIEDLNDNPNGLRVRGANWKVFAPDGKVIGYQWTYAEAWGAAQRYATNTSPTLPDNEQVE